MKQVLITIVSIFITYATLAQPSFEEWEKESKINIRLLPRYGHQVKTQAETDADSAYTKKLMSLPQFKSRRDASNHMINLGFQYYYRPDFKTAMYRFNQAYLLDSTNADIFWGYGAIYMALGRSDLAKEQYALGLAIDSNNTHLLTDLATYFMEQFYIISQMPKADVVQNPKELARSNLILHYYTSTNRINLILMMSTQHISYQLIIQMQKTASRPGNTTMHVLP